MKATITCLALMLSAGYADVLTTRTGEKIEYLKVSRIAPDGISLEVQNGIQKVPYEKLSDADRTKYELTLERVEAFRSKKEMEQQKVQDEAKLAEQIKPQAKAAPVVAPAKVLINPAPLVQMVQMETATAGARRISGFPGSRPGARYTEGKWKGKTKEQLIAACVERFAGQYGYRPVYEEGAPIGGWQSETARAQATANTKAKEEADQEKINQMQRDQELRRLRDDVERLKR